jgi:aarF domain-containing kinase
MEYCEGVDVGELSQMKDPALQNTKRDISKKMTQLYSEMIFLHGYVHCDPHPGNLRIELGPKGKLIIHLLDHGLYSVSYLPKGMIFLPNVFIDSLLM